MERQERLDESFDWRDFLEEQDIIRRNNYGQKHRTCERRRTQRKQTKNNI